MRYKNIKCLRAVQDTTKDKVYAVVDTNMRYVSIVDDVGERTHLGLGSLMARCWEPTDEEVTV